MDFRSENQYAFSAGSGGAVWKLVGLLVETFPVDFSKVHWLRHVQRRQDCLVTTRMGHLPVDMTPKKSALERATDNPRQLVQAIEASHVGTRANRKMQGFAHVRHAVQNLLGNMGHEHEQSEAPCETNAFLSCQLNHFNCLDQAVGRGHR